MAETIRLKVAAANLNQTILNFTRNVPNILTAIDKAVEDGADVLSLQELGLTGYTGDDYFKWINNDKQQAEILKLVQYVADYANQKNPNLVVSLGFPFFYSDKNESVKMDVGTKEHPFPIDNPLYNINNRPYNAQAFLSAGKIHGISAKSIQPDGAAEYESRQFLSWPDSLGVKKITLVTGQKVPLGKVVLELEKDGKKVNLYHEICAEAWPGIYDDGTINRKEQMEGRYLARLAKNTDLSLVINPSASKPEPDLDKMKLRESLCTTGSELTGGAGYVYTNCLGLEAGYGAFEGGAIFAETGKVAHRSQRYDFSEVSYASAVLDVPLANKGKADATVTHKFTNHDKATIGKTEAYEFGEHRRGEEICRNTALWLRDYLLKTGQQGFVISLSGGKDSAFGAVMIGQMIDLSLLELEKTTGSKSAAVVAFCKQFSFLKYADEVIKTNQDQGAGAAIELLKKNLLTCIYMPSNNSSKDTEIAARTLIEGGITEDGKPIKGLGGSFRMVNVQDVVDSSIEAFAGLVRKDVPADLFLKAKDEIAEYVKGKRTAFSEDVATQINHYVPSWTNAADNITLQNIQARARLPIAWLHGNQENKIACVTSNLSEAFAGYWTFGGDGHMGSINICGGIFKSDLTDALKMLQERGLDGLSPVEGLYWVNKQKPSAELRPLDVNGKIIQFDEDDMMPYPQLDAIARAMILEKRSPVDASEHLKTAKAKDGSPLFSSNKELVECIEECTWRWESSQFKRVASVVTPFLGNNMDPHQSVRTTILSEAFRTGRAQLKLEYLKEEMGGTEEDFKKGIGEGFEASSFRAIINQTARDSINQSSLADLRDAVIKASTLAM